MDSWCRNRFPVEFTPEKAGAIGSCFHRNRVLKSGKDNFTVDYIF